MRERSDAGAMLESRQSIRALVQKAAQADSTRLPRLRESPTDNAAGPENGPCGTTF